MTISDRASGFRLSLALPVAVALGVACALLAALQPMATLIAMASGIGLAGLAQAGPLLPILIAGIGAVAITFPILLAFGLGRVPLSRAARNDDADQTPATQLRAGAYPPPADASDSEPAMPRRPFSAATELELELSSDQMVPEMPVEAAAEPEEAVTPPIEWPLPAASVESPGAAAAKPQAPAETVVESLVEPEADVIVGPMAEAAPPAEMDDNVAAPVDQAVLADHAPEPLPGSDLEPSVETALQPEMPTLPAGLIARKGQALAAPLPDDFASDVVGGYVRPPADQAAPQAPAMMEEPEVPVVAASNTLATDDDDYVPGIDAPVVNPVGAELADLAARFPAAMPEDVPEEFRRAPDLTGPPISETVHPIEQSVVRRGHPLRSQAMLPGAADAEEEEMNTRLNTALGSLKRLVARR